MKNIADLIREAIKLPEAKIENHGAFGGMTNLNYLVSINSDKYIVRMPGNGTEAFINRSEEKENLQLGTALGINPELIYFNAETGMKITRKISGAETLTPQTAARDDIIKKVTGIFRNLHESNIQMINRFKLFELMDKYEQLALDANARFFEDYKDVKREILALKSVYESLAVKETPCHIDPSYTNFIIGKERLYLIDWEYSGMFDPLWDLAAYSMESGFSQVEESLFLAHYFGRERTEAESQRILMHKIFQDYLWSLWTLFKEARGDNFGSYGINRFIRLKKNITIYNEIFNQSETG